MPVALYTALSPSIEEQSEKVSNERSREKCTKGRGDNEIAIAATKICVERPWYA